MHCQNLVGPVGQGKSQSQDFTDEFHSLGRMLVQIVSLVCWYPLSVLDCVPHRSFLLLSVLQIVDSRLSWILVSVLGELCSTSRIAIVLPVWWGELPGLNTRLYVYWLFLVWGFICFGCWKEFFACFIVLCVFIPGCCLSLLDLCFSSSSLAVMVFLPDA